MSRQLELDINRPSWHETNYKSEGFENWDSAGDMRVDTSLKNDTQGLEKKEILIAEYPSQSQK